MHGLLEAVGVDHIPVGQTEESLVRKILQDNFFWNRVLARLVELEAVATAKNLPMLERDALRDRIAPRPKKQPVTWSIKRAADGISGRTTIIATCGPETINWQGKDVRKFHWHGEAVPADIAYLYELETGPRPDPTNAALLRADERARLQYAQDHQKRSPEEILVAEQYGRLPK